jgi:hypothetical protein
MKTSNQTRTIIALIVGMITTFAVTETRAGVTLTPVDVSRLYAFGDGIQSDGSGGYLGDLTIVEDEWNVLTGPMGTPGASAEDDPIAPPTDGWTLEGVSSFAIAHSRMVDDGGWSSVDDNDAFELFVNNQATQDPGDAYAPEGWGYSVSYMLITYDTAPTGPNSLGDPMTIEMNLDFSALLYAAKIYDEYLLDVGYAMGTGITDYNPVLDDPAGNPNPGLDQFDNYQSWRSIGFSWEEPAFSDSSVYNGVIGDQIQVLIAASSFSYSWWGYTWTDGTANVTVTATVEEPSVFLVPLDIKPQSCPNPINTLKFGVIPVAIAGTDSLDVSQIDPESILLEGVSPIRWNMEDVATPYEPYSGKEEETDCTEEGVLVLTLTGQLKDEFGGTPIQGEDVIIVIVPRRGSQQN